MSTFQGLEIAKSGMLTYNACMQTAAHNLANVGTRGYSRQVVKTSAQIRNVSSIKVIGAGAYVQEVVREHNNYYDIKYRKENATYNKYGTHSYYLKHVQTYIYAKNEEDGGITTAFDQFCKTLTGSVGDGGDATKRKEITTVADTLTSFIQSTASDLRDLQEEANEEIKSCVDQINALAQKIAAVTKQINTLEAYGNPANDLRDQREVLIDELSEYCNVKVVEEEPANGVGLPQFYLYVNGGILLDTYRVNELKVTEMDTTKAINDISGLYKVSWADGSPFNEYSSDLGGKLQGLYEVRDGNNSTTLSGTIAGIENNKDGNIVVTMSGANINDVNLLNIPAQDGEITINNSAYSYDTFEVQVSDSGEFTYKFTLKQNMSVDDAKALQHAVNVQADVVVGDNVAYKGVPYYMAQLNEFVRTYSQKFNDTHKGGYDDYENQGIDFFNAKVPADGANYIFTSRGEGGHDASFTSLAKKEENGTYTGSYYYMTALNICVTDAVMKDPKLLAFNELQEGGKSEGLNLKKLADLKDDSKMFLHGAPDSFLQSMTADVGVDCKKALTMEESQLNIRDAVDIQRQAVSGPDEDEETEALLTFQKMLFNQYKVLSVMNEVLDKLINQMAV